MIAIDKQEPEFYTQEHTRLAMSFAAQAAIAIENARLFDETRQAREAALEAQHATEEANRAKSTFLANMSYELRTPLNTQLNQAAGAADRQAASVMIEQIRERDEALADTLAALVKGFRFSKLVNLAAKWEQEI